MIANTSSHFEKMTKKSPRRLHRVDVKDWKQERRKAKKLKQQEKEYAISYRH